jgi:hypothetical protein
MCPSSGNIAITMVDIRVESGGLAKKSEPERKGVYGAPNAPDMKARGKREARRPW